MISNDLSTIEMHSPSCQVYICTQGCVTTQRIDFFPCYYLWAACVSSPPANKEIGNLSLLASGYPSDTLFLYLL